MKKLFLLLFVILSANCMAQIRTGLLVGGGSGSIYNRSVDPNVDVNTAYPLSRFSTQYQFNTSIGYRFRLEPVQSRFFYDFDVLAGLKMIKFKQLGDGGALISTEGSDIFPSVALAAFANYRIIQGAFVGIGVAPTCIIGPDKSMFDIPVSAKVGYNFNNKIEFSFNYQYSMLNAFKTKEYTGGRFSEWSVSVFVPFTFSGKK